MSGNNTTADICYNALNETIECVAESSSILDDIEVVLLAVAALLGIAAWAKQKYAKMMEDGELSLDEVIDSMGDVKEKVAEAKEEVEKIEKTLDSHNVAELKAMLKEAGLSVSGKKADLVARLEAYKDGE